PFRLRPTPSTYSGPKIGAKLSPKWLVGGAGCAAKLLAMPLEGHYRRVNTPLRALTGRERNVVIWGTVATAVAVLVLILATVRSSHAGPAKGCIRASIAGRTGAELIQRCGADAVATCRQARGFGGPAGEAILAACRDAAVKF